MRRREQVVAAARGWLGTPYRHQASRRGVGCDCLGLVRGVWREVIGPEPETPPPYARDWAEVGGAETLLAAAARWLTPIDAADAQPGDVLLFRMAENAAVKHCAILSAQPTTADPHARMIHAYWGRAVVESWLSPWWSRRLAAAFAIPPAPPSDSAPVIPAEEPGPRAAPGRGSTLHTVLGPGSALRAVRDDSEEAA